jgi:hypothetical protein
MSYLAKSLPVGLWVAIVVAVSCSSDPVQETLCVPGENIFCRCRGGSAGTKECLSDGNSFGPCEGYSGTCAELPDSNGGEGGSEVPGGGDKPPPPPGELLAACSGDTECGAGMTCPMGYCTKPCTSYEECGPPEPAEAGDCVMVGEQAWCVPYCITEQQCEIYGPDSHCSYTDEALPPFDVVVCANWGEEIWLPPDGYPDGDDVQCPFDEMCNLGWAGTERVCQDGGCTDGCHQQTDCIDPAADCSSAGPELLGTCGGTSTVEGDRCPGVRIDVSAANSPQSHQGDTSVLPPPSEAKGIDSCAPGASASEELFYEVWPAESGNLIVLVEPDDAGFDPQVYARSDACTTGPQVACANDELAGGGEIFEVSVTAGEKLTVVVDGWNGSAGAYTIEFDLTPQ